MPWKTSSLLEARQRFVRAALRRCKSVAQLCQDFGISAKTGFKWLGRYRATGGPGLADRPRRPKHSPNRTPRRWVKAIVRARNEHPSWGAKKIQAYLQRKQPRARLPKLRTIAEWLRREGLVRPGRRWARRGPQL